MTLYPTYTCFDDAAEIMVDMIRGQHCRAKDGSVTLVHALLTASGGEEYAHAWIEDNDGCVFFMANTERESTEKICLVTDREDYYTAHNVHCITRYTPRQAFDLSREHGGSGPWEEKYIVRCVKDGETPRDLGMVQGKDCR